MEGEDFQRTEAQKKQELEALKRAESERLEWRSHQQKEAQLVAARDELSLLREQNSKLNVRYKELHATLRLREKKVNQLSQELLSVKSSHQQLQEEHGKQQKSLKQQYSQCSDYRTKNQRLSLKNERLKEAYDKLRARVNELDERNTQLAEQSTLLLSLPNSPSPAMNEEDYLSVSSASSLLQQHIGQLEFDRDEMGAKYEEVENEYKDMQEKYYHCQQLLDKVCKDQLSLEREVMLLRSARNDNLIDESRHSVGLLQKDVIKKLVSRIEILENFILEQDEVLSISESPFKIKSLDSLGEELLHAATPTIISRTKGTHPSLHDTTALLEYCPERDSNDSTTDKSKNWTISTRTLSYADGFQTHPSMSIDTVLRHPQLSSNNLLSERDVSLNATPTSSGATFESQACNLELTDEEPNHNTTAPLKCRPTCLDAATDCDDIDNSNKIPHLFKERDREIKDLQNQLLKAQERSSRFQLLLEESEKRLERQEAHFDVATDCDDIDSDKQIPHLLEERDHEIKDLQNQLLGAQKRNSRLQLLLEELEKQQEAHFDVASDCDDIDSNQQIPNLLEERDREIKDLQNQLFGAQEHSSRLQLLLEELEKKLERQEANIDFNKHNLLEERDHEIKDLQSQLFGAQERSSRLQILLKELEKKLELQEAHQLQQLDKDEAIIAELRSKLKSTSQPVVPLEETAKAEIGSNLLPVRKLLCDSDTKRSRLTVANQGQECIDYEVLSDDLQKMKQLNDSALRVFLVVMDYDPLSLCITGQPDLELSVLSGSLIFVLGEMDENGYYTAIHENCRGIIPANFVQEIEIQDQELINRFASQKIVWNTESEYDALTSKESGRSESAIVMSNTSLESVDQTKVCSPTDNQDPSYRIFIGLYDYDPNTSSSNTNPEFELKFKEGSLIKVFGKMMSDGYFIGELNGQRGLVPADFIADTSQYQKLPPPLHLKSKVVVALYDYLPSRDSPNAYPETELEFKAGDIITIFGYMHSDGYYTGHLQGKFGLVPSNFITEK